MQLHNRFRGKFTLWTHRCIDLFLAPNVLVYAILKTCCT